MTLYPRFTKLFKRTVSLVESPKPSAVTRIPKVVFSLVQVLLLVMISANVVQRIKSILCFSYFSLDILFDFLNLVDTG